MKTEHTDFPAEITIKKSDEDDFTDEEKEAATQESIKELQQNLPELISEARRLKKEGLILAFAFVPSVASAATVKQSGACFYSMDALSAFLDAANNNDSYGEAEALQSSAHISRGEHVIVIGHDGFMWSVSKIRKDDGTACYVPMEFVTSE
jgi:hemin uptake protein HemP